ncbi:MAG: Re/Si-specific NAD(P)(+) transhydrogenase subunit alpha [Armatimonadetes bacterium]|nr:Re/Si-specific NAD(P)(+) transhydrogenase subunit alpha [Armatimonadota bacterium]
MIVGAAKENRPGERRAALTPEGVRSLVGKGFEVVIEPGLGEEAGFEDELYIGAGANLADSIWPIADLALKVNEPTPEEAQLLKPRASTVSFQLPLSNLSSIKALADAGATVFSMSLVPRISRAQSMDALSSMSSAAGYRAALLAANHLPKFFPMLMTAAGSIAPARVFVIGAGVAGLQAIATCRRLGAVVEAFDVRPIVKEQVESLGARFVDLGLSPEESEDAGGYAKEVSTDTHRRELEAIAQRLPKTDALITTALVPDRPAPVLITAEMVKLMPKGSLIVDVAAVNGGNCELTRPGESIVAEGVSILGPTNLPSELAHHSTQMYSRNVVSFVLHVFKLDASELDLEDPIVRDSMAIRQGKPVHEATRIALERGGRA